MKLNALMKIQSSRSLDSQLSPEPNYVQHSVLDATNITDV